MSKLIAKLDHVDFDNEKKFQPKTETVQKMNLITTKTKGDILFKIDDQL